MAAPGRPTERPLVLGKRAEVEGVVDAHLGAHGGDGALDAGLGAVEGGDPGVADRVVLDDLGVAHLTRHGSEGRVRLACREGGGAEHANEREEMHRG